jgi:hypothetical protein
MAKKIFITLGVIVFIIGLLIFRPVPIVKEDRAIAVKGTVMSIYEGGVKDVVFKLKDNHVKYYINRGLENGLELNTLKEKLIGNEVVIKYPKYWTPLDWNNEIRHLSKLEFGDEVIFNELK